MGPRPRRPDPWILQRDAPILLKGLDILSRSLANTRSIVLASLLVAVSLGTNYLLLGIPNVKLMDVCTFLAGKHLGLLWGVVVGASTWIIWGTLNPYGISLLTTAIVIAGQSFYAVAGWGLGSFSFNGGTTDEKHPTWHAVAGLLSTLAYDLFTNALVGIIFYGSMALGLLTMNFPLPMGLAHEVSNFILFPLIAVPIEGRMDKLIGKKASKRVVNIHRLGQAMVVVASVSILLNAFLLPNYLTLLDENGKLSGLLKENTVDVNVLVNFGNGTRRWYNSTVLPSGSSLFNATAKLFGDNMIVESSPYGVMIMKLGGAGPSPERPNMYWIWFKWDSNSKTWMMGDTGADQHRLISGESLAWALVDFSDLNVIPSP